MLDQLARLQEQRISDVAAVRDKVLADQKALNDIIAQQSAQDADLAAKKTTIEAQIKDLQKLRQQAYGGGGGTGSLRPVACPVEYIGGAAGKAAATGCAQIGKPYVWGAAGPNSFDCSGFTEYSWGSAGVSLYHYTGTQHDQTMRVRQARSEGTTQVNQWSKSRKRRAGSNLVDMGRCATRRSVVFPM